MKTVFKPLLILLLLVFTAAPAALAQITAEKAAKMKDGVFMNNGQLMQIKNGQLQDAPAGGLTLGDSKISSDGTVTLKNGQRKKLKSGYAVNNEGNVVLLEYDMLKHDAIEEHSTEVLGNTETVIVVSDEGTAIQQGKRPVTEPNITAPRDTVDYKQLHKERRIAEYNRRMAELQTKMDSKRRMRNTMVDKKGKVKKKNQDEVQKLDKEIYDLQEQINALDEKMRSE